MLTDKDQKKKFKKIASEDPDSYFPTAYLKSIGYSRKKCTKCETYFWSNTSESICGDPECVGGFTFIGNSPAKRKLGYAEMWLEFAEFFKKRGYTPINRYPVVARWRDDTDFVQASIYDFQPHVVSGSVKPPANPLTVPQPSLRFNDIDNVGITGSHYSCFVMIGQLAFTPPDKYEQEKYFRDLFEWHTQFLGIPLEEMKIHEDAWAGGGNFGPCMEFFSRGLELCNQVYMMFEQTEEGSRELNIKVLDMGLGMERTPWYTQGVSTSYETTFPTAIKYLKEKTKVKYDAEMIAKFLPFGPMLNADEIDDMDEAWKSVAKKVGTDAEKLKGIIKPLAAIYSIAEHTRTLLFAIHDGALPSNVRGGHNLRVLLRRALSFQEEYGWDFDILELFDIHAEYLKPIYPELSEDIDNVKNIINVEILRFDDQRGRSRRIIETELEKSKGMDFERMKMLYESHGITPEMITAVAKEKEMDVEVKSSFYADITQEHKEAKKKKTVIAEFEGLETRALYFDDWKKMEFESEVIAIKDNMVVLSETYFYPTSGGQMHDKGTINGIEVTDIFKQGNAIIHKIKDDDQNIKKGSVVKGIIEWPRRLQLAQHHTGTHVLNAAAKRVLGVHIWQAGAEKRTDKARLDITHYRSLTSDEEKRIEEEANRIIHEAHPVEKMWLPRDEAEKRYGFVIYQGGAVPGNVLRIVKIENIDVEACGGTHLDNTKEIESIKLLRSTRISDGVVRLEFTAGKAASTVAKEEGSLVDDMKSFFRCDEKYIIARTEELFSKWKKAKKEKKKKGSVSEELKQLISEEEKEGDIVSEAAAILKTQPEHIMKTLRRFKSELDSF